MPPTGDEHRHERNRVDFQVLESLRIFSRQVLRDQSASLEYFAYDPGYQHFKDKKPEISVSSSATCVLSLVATGNWTRGLAQTKALLRRITSKRKSAGLRRNNPFTIAWILETVCSLESPPTTIDSVIRDRVGEMEHLLKQALRNGGVSIDPYPPSAYLTQLVARVLDRRGKLTVPLKKAVSEWAWSDLARQLALVQAKSKTQDAFAIAYLLMLVTMATPPSQMSPEKTSTQRTAVQTLFDCQLPDGTWPLSRPLFHYPNYGNAYCYEYEMLTQLLGQRELREMLLGYLSELGAAAHALSRTVYRISPGVQAWSSGHHPNQPKPESWATASVYHYVHALDRLAADAVRRDLFRYLELPLPTPAGAAKRRTDFAKGFLDGVLRVKRRRRSLKAFLWKEFVKPLSAEVLAIAEGHQFSERTPRSAIFFGPPGTSKTQLAEAIADFLGWSFLAIDPSFLLRNGMDGIQAEANAIFRRLEQTEGVVVLFDEFDELVRERQSDADAFSRFLTTAMLPKLASIHKRRTLVFIIATNNIADFDLAIRRQGRFDHVVQVMPPTYESKMQKTNWGASKIDLGQKLRTLKVRISPKLKSWIGDLTFGECDEFATELASTTTVKEVTSILREHWNLCTLNTKVRGRDGKETTWAKRCEVESSHNR